MFARVQLLNGFKQPLTYAIPTEWSDTHTLVGKVVLVPLQKRIEAALITEIISNLTPIEKTYKIRTIINQEVLPPDQNYQSFIKKTAQFYSLPEQKFLKKLQSFLFQKKVLLPHPTNKSSQQASDQRTLNEEQKLAVKKIIESLHPTTYQPYLLYGVTGSGKTVVYEQIIEQAFLQKKSTLFLVPEVGLAVHFFKHFSSLFADKIPICQFHSASSADERKKTWTLLNNNQAGVIIGVHIPTLLPMPNLGLIIVDEEHDTSFQEQNHPKTNTREIAHIKAQTYKIPIVFGSATPSIHTLYTAQNRSWPILRLSQRYSGASPQIERIALLKDKKRPHFWISKRLQEEIKERLEKKEQSIVFLNRRGFSFFVQCASCGHIYTCPNCSVSLTVHSDKTIRCHYCDYQIAEPTTCTACKAKKLLKKGIGTQQIVQMLENIFPEARIIRADLDTTKNKKKWNDTVEQITTGAVDIIVGTQTITKGYHFPKVTLVGIIWADISLSIPKYNACETTLHQLIQVAGRAGRVSEKSLVLVQYCTEHPIFSYINEENYNQFTEYEMAYRKKLGYPPYKKLIEFELQHAKETIVESESKKLGSFIKNLTTALSLLGPAKPPIHKQKNFHIRTLYLKQSTYHEALKIIHKVKQEDWQCRLHVTLQPL